jgi:hypothetical protein
MKKLFILGTLISVGFAFANPKTREEINNEYHVQLDKLAADLKKCKEYCSSVGPKKEEPNSTDEDKDINEVMRVTENDCRFHCTELFNPKFLDLRRKAAKKTFELFKKELNIK